MRRSRAVSTPRSGRLAAASSVRDRATARRAHGRPRRAPGSASDRSARTHRRARPSRQPAETATQYATHEYHNSRSERRAQPEGFVGGSVRRRPASRLEAREVSPWIKNGVRCGQPCRDSWVRLASAFEIECTHARSGCPKPPWAAVDAWPPAFATATRLGNPGYGSPPDVRVGKIENGPASKVRGVSGDHRRAPGVWPPATHHPATRRRVDPSTSGSDAGTRPPRPQPRRKLPPSGSRPGSDAGARPPRPQPRRKPPPSGSRPSTTNVL